MSTLPLDSYIEWCPTRGVAEVVPDDEWERIERPLRHVHWRRGVERWPGRIEAGEATVTFGDPGRLFDPSNRQSPHWGTWSLGRQVRFRFEVVPGFPVTLWHHYITDITPGWLLRDFWVTFRAADHLAWLAGLGSPAPAVTPETTSDRMQRQLASVVDTARINIEVSDVVMGPEDQASWPAYLERIANTEQGLLFVRRDGVFHFLTRSHEGTFRGTFDTDPSRSVSLSRPAPLQDYAITHDERTFWSKAVVEVTGGAPVELAYTSPGVTTYGEVTFDGDTAFNDLATAEEAARSIVGEGVPRMQITKAVTVLGSMATDAENEALWLTVGNADIGDMERDIARPPDATEGSGPWMTWGSGPFWGATDGRGWGGAPVIDQTSRILAIEQTVDYRAKTWTVARFLEPWGVAPSVDVGAVADLDELLMESGDSLLTEAGDVLVLD